MPQCACLDVDSRDLILQLLKDQKVVLERREAERTWSLQAPDGYAAELARVRRLIAFIDDVPAC